MAERICEACGGSGEVMAIVGQRQCGMGGPYEPTEEADICIDCDGEGWIPVEEEEVDVSEDERTAA